MDPFLVIGNQGCKAQELGRLLNQLPKVSVVDFSCLLEKQEINRDKNNCYGSIVEISTDKKEMEQFRLKLKKPSPIVKVIHLQNNYPSCIAELIEKADKEITSDTLSNLYRVDTWVRRLKSSRKCFMGIETKNLRSNFFEIIQFIDIKFSKKIALGFYKKIIFLLIAR